MKTANKGIFNNPFPVLQTKTNSVTNSNNLMLTYNFHYSKQLFSQIISSENPPSTPTITTNHWSKWPRVTQDNKDGKESNPTPKTQLQLKYFVSYNPNSLSKDLILYKDDGFRLAWKKVQAIIRNLTRQIRNITLK